MRSERSFCVSESITCGRSLNADTGRAEEQSVPQGHHYITVRRWSKANLHAQQLRKSPTCRPRSPDTGRKSEALRSQRTDVAAVWLDKSPIMLASSSRRPDVRTVQLGRLLWADDEAPDCDGYQFGTGRGPGFSQIANIILDTRPFAAYDRDVLGRTEEKVITRRVGYADSRRARALHRLAATVRRHPRRPPRPA